MRWGAIALVGVHRRRRSSLAGILARAGGLRADDVAFIAVGIVPGAVIGGRLGYLIVHSSYYGATPAQLLDPSIGGLELGLAVVGGFVTGALRGQPARRRRSVAGCTSPRCPLLFALGAGKLTMVLTGHGAGRAERCRLGDRLPRPGPVGLAGAGAAVGPVAGARGDRDARRSWPS